jgi:hypothetical protein
LTVSNCTLSHNTANGAPLFGGGLLNDAGATLTVSNSTLSGNSAGSGGGIANDGTTLTVSNSRFCDNIRGDIFRGYTDEGGNTFC